MRDYGVSPAQQDEIWRRWREGQSFSLIGRALGAPMQIVRRFLHQSGGVRITPKQRSERHLSGSEGEEISRGIAAAGRQLAGRLGRSPSTVSREIARNGGRDRYRAASADEAAYARGRRPKQAKLAQRPALRTWARRSRLCAGLPIRSQGGCADSSLVTPPCRSRTKRSTSRSTTPVATRQSTAASLSACRQTGPCAARRSPVGLPGGASSAAWCPSLPAPPRSRTGRSPVIGRATS